MSYIVLENDPTEYNVFSLALIFGAVIKTISYLIIVLSFLSLIFHH